MNFCNNLKPKLCVKRDSVQLVFKQPNFRVSKSEIIAFKFNALNYFLLAMVISTARTQRGRALNHCPHSPWRMLLFF